MKKVLGIGPNLGDGTSWYRLVGPYKWLEKTERSFQIDFKDHLKDWYELMGYDVLIIQRPFKQEHLAMLQRAKDLKIKTIVEYDDDLINVPHGNPAQETYSDPGLQRVVSKIISLADEVTVSTNALKKLYSVFNENIHVIPNALNDYILDERKTDKKLDKIFAWRGSRTHDADLDHYLPAMKAAHDRLPRWQWMFWTKKIYFKIRKEMVSSRVKHFEPFELPQYFVALNLIPCEAAFVPLEDNKFNYAKSNIAYLEFAYAGCAVIAPNWEEWHEPGILHYDDNDSLLEAFLTIDEDESLRRRLQRDGWESVRDKYMLSKVNHLRMEVLQRVFG